MGGLAIDEFWTCGRSVSCRVVGRFLFRIDFNCVTRFDDGAWAAREVRQLFRSIVVEMCVVKNGRKWILAKTACVPGRIRGSSVGVVVDLD